MMWLETRVRRIKQFVRVHHYTYEVGHVLEIQNTSQ